MAVLDTARKLLTSIRDETDLYWRNTKRPFTCLTAFLDGYQVGFFVGGSRCRIDPSDLIPEDFPTFVRERLSRTLPAGDRCWQECIRESTKSEEEAFALFFTFRHQYDEDRKQRAKTVASPNRRRARLARHHARVPRRVNKRVSDQAP